MKKILNKLLFLDVTPIIKLGKNAIFEAKDALPLHFKINPRIDYFNENDLNYKLGPYHYLMTTIKASKKEIIPAYFWYVISSILTLLSPVLVHEFIASLSVGYFEQNIFKTLTLGISLGLCGIFSGLFLQQYFYHALMSYQILINIINKKIFDHSLKLSIEGRQKNLIGDIVNYLASDSESVADFTFIFGDLACNALLLIGIVSMLFYYLGVSTIYALLAMAILIPFTKKLAKRFTSLEDEMMSFRDQRVTLITQILNSIRIVKYFSLERSFANEVMEIRNQELGKRKKLAKSEVFSGLIFVSMNSIVLLVALTAHNLRGQSIDAALVFTCVSLFGLLDGPIGELSHLISRLTNAKVGAKRIKDYLEADTIKLENNLNLSNYIIFDQYNAKYTHDQNLALKNINYKFDSEKSYAIVGPVGAGKSTLLQAILGELKIESGSLKINLGLKKSYVPQDAFILNDTLKHNITFGNTFTEQDLTEALYCSALDRDLIGLHLNLNTEIGEKGLNLSGGQKQRVSLARATLNDPQILLLDDPLSAVDHITENLICDRLIFGKFQNRLRIVVTHRLGHLKRFDEILFIKDGEIIESGCFDDLYERSNDFKLFYQSHLKSHDDISITHQDASLNTTNEGNRITIEEDREKGAVKSSLYFDYIKSLGGNSTYKNLILITLFLGAVLLALIPLSQKYWLSYITNPQNNITILKGLYVYGILSIAVLILGFLNNYFWLDRGIKASQFLHDQMLNAVLKAPIRFFDSTPIGRIIQRFSRDIESVDIHLQWSFISVVNCILQVSISLGLILTTMPYLILAIIPIFIIYYSVQNDYRKSAREAKRLDSIARSPRYAHFKETLQGLIVIRAYQKEKWFRENFLNHLSYGQQMFYTHYMLNRWFSSRIPIIGGLISILTAIPISILAHKNILQPGLAGLITVYSLSFWGYLNWGVRVFSDIESRMTSIERLNFFASLPPEPDTSLSPYTVINDQWPPDGAIHFNNVSARYATHLPLVLNHINFEVRPKTKIGIIGKTGSGKSTLFQCLFRFMELESGEITIDGLNIQRIPLMKLRKSMAIIPQDPALFIGTIRSNLDRYNEYTDQEIDNALTNCGLYDFVYSLPEKTNFKIFEGGSNLSQGQRQLLCLGRALLTKAKIIVMDEATASVDVRTDELLQKIISEKLQDVTLLIIAHRLGTIKDCDSIIEITNGHSKIIKDY